MSTLIAEVDALRIAGRADYREWVGLRTPRMPEVALRASQVLDGNAGRHVCAYPAQMETLLVKITADDGTVGWGEAHSPPVPRVSQVLIEDLARPLLLGQDPLAIEALWDRLYHSMRLRGHSTGFMMEALAGVDIALWDLKGKLLGEPVYRLLGGPFPQYLADGDADTLRVPCYASGVPGADLDQRIASAEAFVEMGFSAMKLSIGRGGLEEDLHQVRVLCEALGARASLLVDAHGCYDGRTAVSAARRMEEMGVRWLEDPLAPEEVDAYAALCAAVDLPIANGETECNRWQYLEKMRRSAADIVLPDIARAGGISEGRRIAEIADLFGVPWCAHVSSSSWPHRLAALHLAVASPRFLLCEWPNPLAENPLAFPLLDGEIRCEGGFLYLPPGPGLGMIVDEERLAEHIVRDTESDDSGRQGGGQR